MPRTSPRGEDCRIKTIVDNMHPLIIDRAATNKRLLPSSSAWKTSLARTPPT
uniref:Uncharacterized protein n=1 Tax=Romanomermis culicivorax TaxID=13658 RepID=A0A915HT65_ROMCU